MYHFFNLKICNRLHITELAFGWSTVFIVIMSTITGAQSTAHEKIKTLEEQYNELNSDLKDAVKRVHDNEHSIVICLQTLMPLQNSYLTGIINNLQQQVQQLRVQQTQYQQSMAPPPTQVMPTQQTANHSINMPTGQSDNNIQTNITTPQSNTNEPPPRRRRNNSVS